MEKAVLLEMQLKEAIDREGNLKKLNESLMNAMGDINKQEKSKDIQILNNIHDEQLHKLKTQYQEKITILEYELRKQGDELTNIQQDYQQLVHDYQELDQKKCKNCDDLADKLNRLQKLFEHDKECWAREFRDALQNQKSVMEYDCNVLKVKLKQSNYDLEIERREKDKLHRTMQEIHNQHEQTQRSLLSQINELHRAHNETILQNNEFQMRLREREQNHVSKECHLEQEKIILEKHTQEFKDQIQKLDQQNKLLTMQLVEKENKFYEYKSELNKKLIQEKKTSEQCQQLAKQIKDDSMRKQTILMDDCLKKEQQLKHVQAQLHRQKSKNKYYESTMSQPSIEHKNSTPKLFKHKKNNYSNEFVNNQQIIAHSKNALSQGHISKIKLFPSSIQKSEADSIHFNLTEMLNTTRNPLDNNLSSRQNEENIVEQFNIKTTDHLSSQISIPMPERTRMESPPQIMTDRMASPKTRIPTNFKMPLPQRIKTNNNTENTKENNSCHFKQK